MLADVGVSNVLFSGRTDSRSGLANVNSVVFAHAATVKFPMISSGSAADGTRGTRELRITVSDARSGLGSPSLRADAAAQTKAMSATVTTSTTTDRDPMPTIRHPFCKPLLCAMASLESSVAVSHQRPLQPPDLLGPPDLPGLSGLPGLPDWHGQQPNLTFPPRLTRMGGLLYLYAVVGRSGSGRPSGCRLIS